MGLTWGSASLELCAAGNALHLRFGGDEPAHAKRRELRTTNSSWQPAPESTSSWNERTVALVVVERVEVGALVVAAARSSSVSSDDPVVERIQPTNRMAPRPTAATIKTELCLRHQGASSWSWVANRVSLSSSSRR